MKLYIIRHGDPDYTNDTLTPLGWKEAEALVPRMKHIQPTDIYTSPLGRAQDTARPTCKALNMSYQVEEWMRESMDYMQRWDGKEESGQKAGFTVTLEQGATLLHDFAEQRDERVTNMIRSSDEFLARHGYVREGYRYRAVNPNDKRICCFCHGGFGSAWISHLLGNYPVFNWYQFCVLTTSVTLFHFHADESGYAVPNASYIGDLSHLWNLNER